MKQQLISRAAALRMWHELKNNGMTQGFCLFDKDGRGGAWYSDNDQPDMSDSDIKWECDHNGEYGTFNEFYDEIYEFLESRKREQDDMDE